MLTDQEILDAMAAAPTGWTSQATLLAIGRAVEGAVLAKLATPRAPDSAASDDQRTWSAV